MIEVRATLDASYGAEASYSLMYAYARGAWMYLATVRGEAGRESAYRPIANRIAASFRFR